MAFDQIAKLFSTNKNYAFEISVLKCGKSESEGRNTFELNFGDLRFKNNNITYNKCNQYSSILSILAGKSGYYNFSTFRENNQTESDSLRFFSYSDSYIQIVSYCNVIGNICGMDMGQALFWCCYNANVDHCVFLNNTAAWMFYIEREGYTLTITDSCIQSNSKTGQGALKLIIESTPHFDSENCFIGSKVMSAKGSYFCALAESSIALFTKKH